MVDKFWPATCQFPPKNIRGNEILFNYCPKIYDRKKKIWVIRSETLVEGCKGWERKAYEFPGHKVYSIAVDSLFFLSFTKRVFRHPDLPASSPVRHFASGNLKARCGVAILALSRFNFAKAHTFYRYVRGGQQKLVHIYMCDLSPLFPQMGIFLLYRPANRLISLVPTICLCTARRNSIGIDPYNHLVLILKKYSNKHDNYRPFH